MAYYSGNFLLSLLIYFDARVFSFPVYLLLLSYQVAQLTHILSKRLSELAEEIERERMLKNVANATTRDKVKAAEIAEKKA